MRGKYVSLFFIGLLRRHLIAICSGLIAIMPLVIIGALALILNNLSGFGLAVGATIWMGSFAIIGLLTAFSISYNLAKSHHIDGLSAGLITVAVFITIVPVTVDRGLSIIWLGLQGLLVAVILALLVTELIRYLIHFGLTIKAPKGLPDGVASSITALLPAATILLLTGFTQSLLSVHAKMSIFEMIANVF